MGKGLISILLFALLLSSCATYKAFDYASIESYTALEGVYCDSSKTNPVIFKLEFRDQKSLNWFVLGYDDWELKDSYKGKYNKKEHTFDIWKSRKVLPFIILVGYDFEKMRVGKDIDGNLIINEAHDHLGMLIPLGANGDRYSIIKKISPLIEYPPLPVLVDDKWGYRDFLTDSILIEARYDSVCSFEREIARVQVNDKWGVIDKKGMLLIPLHYDEIKPFDTDIFYVRMNDKWGVIDRAGKCVVPCNYIKIDPFYRQGYACVYSENGLVGLIHKNDGVIIPAVYDKIQTDTHYSPLEIDKFVIHKSGLKGIAGADGVIYPSVFENIRLIADKKHPDIIAYTVLKAKMYYLDDKGYVYPETKLSLGDIFSNAIIRVKPDYEKKIHYTELLDMNN